MCIQLLFLIIYVEQMNTYINLANSMKFFISTYIGKGWEHGQETTKDC